MLLWGLSKGFRYPSGQDISTFPQILCKTIFKYHSWYLCQISLQTMLLSILIWKCKLVRTRVWVLVFSFKRACKFLSCYLSPVGFFRWSWQINVTKENLLQNSHFFVFWNLRSSPPPQLTQMYCWCYLYHEEIDFTSPNKESLLRPSAILKSVNSEFSLNRNIYCEQ